METRSIWTYRGHCIMTVAYRELFCVSHHYLETSELNEQNSQMTTRDESKTEPYSAIPKMFLRKYFAQKFLHTSP